MRRFVIASILGGAVFGALPAAAQDEAALVRLLDGLVAGQPLQCVSARQLRESSIVAGTAIIYRTTGSRSYVNRPRGALALLRDDRILITRSPSTQLCEGDVVDLANRTDGAPDATITLGRFIPYDKPRDR